MFLTHSRALPTVHRRSFVSTVLLSHTWENETVVDLRKEAKARGLSSKGNKSTLVARIREHEEIGVTSASPPIHTIRSASTTAPPALRKRTSQAASPGIPLPEQPDNASAKSGFVAIKLPNLSHPPHNPHVQIPYVPDFWDSAQPKALASLEPELPKLYVVGGSATHYDGGPTYGLEKLREDDSMPTTVQADVPSSSKEAGFWPEFCESLGLPRPLSLRRTLSNLAAQEGKDESQTQSRPLTDEERKGLYVLLGIVGGSWLVGGFMN